MENSFKYQNNFAKLTPTLNNQYSNNYFNLNMEQNPKSHSNLSNQSTNRNTKRSFDIKTKIAFNLHQTQLVKVNNQSKDDGNKQDILEETNIKKRQEKQQNLSLTPTRTQNEMNMQNTIQLINNNPFLYIAEDVSPLYNQSLLESSRNDNIDIQKKSRNQACNLFSNRGGKDQFYFSTFNQINSSAINKSKKKSPRKKLNVEYQQVQELLYYQDGSQQFKQSQRDQQMNKTFSYMNPRNIQDFTKSKDNRRSSQSNSQFSNRLQKYQEDYRLRHLQAREQDQDESDGSCDFGESRRTSFSDFYDFDNRVYDENGAQIKKNYKGEKVIIKGLKPEEIERRRALLLKQEFESINTHEIMQSNIINRNKAKIQAFQSVQKEEPQNIYSHIPINSRQKNNFNQRKNSVKNQEEYLFKKAKELKNMKQLMIRVKKSMNNTQFTDKELNKQIDVNEINFQSQTQPLQIKHEQMDSLPFITESNIMAQSLLVSIKKKRQNVSVNKKILEKQSFNEFKQVQKPSIVSQKEHVYANNFNKLKNSIMNRKNRSYVDYYQNDQESTRIRLEKDPYKVTINNTRNKFLKLDKDGQLIDRIQIKIIDDKSS